MTSDAPEHARTAKTLFIASDHAGFSLKSTLISLLQAKGWSMIDLGTHATESCDYPNFAHVLCEKVLETGAFGILVCGTGIGMSIAANRHKGIRAAVCVHEFHARAARQHNNANVLCLGARLTAPGLAEVLAETFLTTAFEGGRHERRVSLIEIE